LFAHLRELSTDRPHQPPVARQAEHVVDLFRLTPGHDRVSGKARVRPDPDLHLGPARPDSPHDRLERLDTPRRGIDVAAAQLRPQQKLAAEDVQWQVAVLAVVAVEEAPLLLPVQRIVCGIEVQQRSAPAPSRGHQGNSR
jgi:hypothetical protein